MQSPFREPPPFPPPPPPPWPGGLTTRFVLATLGWVLGVAVGRAVAGPRVLQRLDSTAGNLALSLALTGAVTAVFATRYARRAQPQWPLAGHLAAGAFIGFGLVLFVAVAVGVVITGLLLGACICKGR